MQDQTDPTCDGSLAGLSSFEIDRALAFPEVARRRQQARPTDGQPGRGVFLDTGRCGLDRLPPGSRVLTDGGLHRGEPDGSITPLEDPEVARRRQQDCERWVAQLEARSGPLYDAIRNSDRRIAAEDAIAARRHGAFRPAGRRTPAPRPAARRPRRSSSSSRTSGSDPGSEGDSDSEPPPPRGPAHGVEAAR